MLPKRIVALGAVTFGGLVASIIYPELAAVRHEADFGKRGTLFKQGVSGLSVLSEALNRHFKADGRFPASLNELVPGYLESLPNAPYLGRWGYAAHDGGSRCWIEFGVGPYLYPSCGRTPTSDELSIDD